MHVENLLSYHTHSHKWMMVINSLPPALAVAFLQGFHGSQPDLSGGSYTLKPYTNSYSWASVVLVVPFDHIPRSKCRQMDIFMS